MLKSLLSVLGVGFAALAVFFMAFVSTPSVG